VGRQSAALGIEGLPWPHSLKVVLKEVWSGRNVGRRPCFHSPVPWRGVVRHGVPHYIGAQPLRLMRPPCARAVAARCSAARAASNSFFGLRLGELVRPSPHARMVVPLQHIYVAVSGDRRRFHEVPGHRRPIGESSSSPSLFR
jgi:hypothetical protein